MEEYQTFKCYFKIYFSHKSFNFWNSQLTVIQVNKKYIVITRKQNIKIIFLFYFKAKLILVLIIKLIHEVVF